MTKNLIISILSIIIIIFFSFLYFTQNTNPSENTTGTETFTTNTYTSTNLSFDYPDTLNISTFQNQIYIRDNNTDSPFELNPGELWITLSPTTEADYNQQQNSQTQENYASHTSGTQTIIKINNNYYLIEMLIGGNQTPNSNQISAFETIKNSLR